MESPQSSVLVDPLADFSLVSLFPRTFNQRDFDPDPNPGCNDPLEAFGPHLESMALKNPSRLLEEAKSILDGGLESLNVDNLENVGTHDSEGDVPGVRNANLKGNVENLKHARDEDNVGDIRGEKQENVKVRRPGLGRKKARFSLKPVSSQPTEFVPYVDMDKLSDPEEFFAALEKQENAKDEWRRQSGQPLMDLDQNVPCKGERRRRPGLLGKSATYKHRVSIAPSVDNYTFLSSQETLSQDLCSPTPSDHVLQPEQSAVLPLSSTREGAGKANAEKERPNGISDELPSQEEKDDGADEIIAMLQKRFKPIEIPESCLPELNSIFENELKTIGEPVQDSHDIMSDLHNVVSAIGKETTLGCDSVERRSGQSSISPTPPKSPYSSISLLKARLFQSRKEKDNFSALDIDVSPLAKATSSQDASDWAARRSKKSVKDNKGNSMMPVVSSDFIEYTKLDDGPVEDGEMDMDPKSPLHEKESDTANILETAEDISKTLGVNSDGIMQDDFDHAFSRDQSPKPAAHSKESNVVHKDVCDFDAEKLAPCQETLGDSSIVSDTALNTSPQVDFDNDIMFDNTRDGVSEDNPSDVFDGAAISANEHAEPDVRVLDKDVQVCNIEKSNNNKEQSTVIAIDNLEKHGSSSDRIKLSTADAVGGDLDHDRPSSSSARPLEKTPKASSKKSESKRSKARAKTRAAVTRKPSRESEFCSRNTLLGCGTQWETGVRRSTRIRTRPLEYWKGEKLLYGRIHDGLITVVGTKYYSPGKETGKASLKVKSYVSDEYKDFVEWVGLH